MSVVFDSKDEYMANANDPEQERWYLALVELLDGEPRWIDGDVLSTHHV